MQLLGPALGIATAVLFGLAILNFLVKWINRKWVMKLPKENAFRSVYQTTMKFLVKNHRYFGFGAAALMVAHVVIQIIFAWVSITGIITAALAVVTMTIGIVLFKSKKRNPALLWAHRGAVLTLIAAFITHVITRI